MTEELNDLAHAAENAAEFYRGKPAYVGPETTIDLYETIARLARIVAERPLSTPLPSGSIER